MINRNNFFIIVSILFLSCGERTGNGQSKQETPKALQENKLDIKSYGRSGDLMEELYLELVDKTPELKKLEDDIETLGQKSKSLKDIFDRYDSKSNSYYSSSSYKVATISDSLLKARIISFIATSNKKYVGKTTELNSLMRVISKNGTTLNDYHSVLKIVLTLPIIEKYQDDNKPNKKEFEDVINEQEKLIKQTDSITPKY